MQNEKMQEAESVQPVSMLLLPSPALLLAEGEAALKARPSWLRTQQRGRVAKGKKGRFRAALRHLWGKTKSFGVCRPRLGSRHRGPFHYTAPARRPERKGESGDAVPQMPRKKEAR